MKRVFATTDYAMSHAEIANALFKADCEAAKRHGTKPPRKPLSNERIRQIEVCALRKIRQSLGMPVSLREMNQR